MTCHCKHQDAQKVTLVNGDSVCSWCPRWLIECEARELLKSPLEERRERLRNRELKRGDVTELKEVMIQIVNSRKVIDGIKSNKRQG